MCENNLGQAAGKILVQPVTPCVEWCCLGLFWCYRPICLQLPAFPLVNLPIDISLTFPIGQFCLSWLLANYPSQCTTLHPQRFVDYFGFLQSASKKRLWGIGKGLYGLMKPRLNAVAILVDSSVGGFCNLLFH